MFNGFFFQTLFSLCGVLKSLQGLQDFTFLTARKESSNDIGLTTEISVRGD